MEYNALADGEFGAVLIDLDDALADETGVGHALGNAGQLAGDALQLGIVGGIQHGGLRDAQVHGGILQRHMGAAVEGSGHTGIRTQHMDGQTGISGGHIDLVVAAAGGEGAEGMEEHLLAGSGQTGGYASGVALGNAGLEGPVRVVFPQLLGVDAAHQVAVHIDDGLVLRHHFIQCQSQRVTAGAGVLFMLSNYFYTHCSHPP